MIRNALLVGRTGATLLESQPPYWYPYIEPTRSGSLWIPAVASAGGADRAVAAAGALTSTPHFNPSTTKSSEV